MYRVICIIVFLFINFGVFAQPYSNRRLKRYTELSDTIKLDTLSIIPTSIAVFDSYGRLIDTTLYKVNYSKAELIFNRGFQSFDVKELKIIYRVFPLSFSKPFYNKDLSKLISADSLIGRESPRYIANTQQRKPFGDNIETSGSISRGISFGNNQDVVVNSDLNLQISGELENGLKIEGAISDKSIPFQPQGNTQRLEEFDRIYLRAYSSRFELQAGDVELQMRGKGFLQYSRKVQGLALSANNNYLSKGDTTLIHGAASVAKGKFARKNFNGIEGNQGPYKLSGAEGEAYIIIIAGSERVYIDGKLLTRGETNHYTIDYNTAELTFTPMMRITGNRRISIEFEYTDRSYARFIVASGVELRIGKTTLRVEAFSEQDSKNQPIDQNMSSQQIELLKSVGDRIYEAFVPQVDSMAYNSDKIMYEKRDTTVNAVTYKIFKQSTNSTNSHFVLNFSYLGEGKGNYTPQYNNANGRVYVWIAPVNGKPSGSYEPVRNLVTPKRKQMVNIQAEKKLGHSDFIKSEVAFSRNDINTFATIDKSNDVGQAVHLEFEKSLSKDTLQRFWIFGEGLISSTNFTYVDRYRPVEFERDWNIISPTTGGDEKEVSGGIGYRTKRWSILGKTHLLRLADGYNGFKNAIEFALNTQRFGNRFEFSNVASSDSINKSSFSRFKYNFDVKIYKAVSAITIEGEDNSQKSAFTQRLLPSSFRWVQSELSVGLPDSLPRMVGLSYKYRKDWKSADSLLRLYSYSQDFGLKARLAKNQSSRLNFFAGYRIFNPVDTTLSKTAKKENTLLGKLDYFFVLGKGSITSNVGYEIGKGLEPKYQFYYIEVPAGQGVFMWNDYNANGVKELDEFEIARFKDEAKFIRINLPTSSYITVNNTALSLQFDILPERIIRDTSSISQLIKKLSNQFSYNSRQKNRFADFSKSINPLMNDAYDSSIVSINENYRNAITYNRFSRIFGLEWVNSGSIMKQVQANGSEIGRIRSNQLSMWFAVSSSISMRLNYLYNRKIQDSEFFKQRNHDIKRNTPSVNIRYTGMFGFNAQVGYEYEYANNFLGVEENKLQTISAEISYSLRSKSWLNLKSNLSMVNFKGDLGTPLEYEFLRGFKPGKNATWELSYKRKISTYFEMNISYNGRYISTGNVVHTGSMEVRAVF